MKFIKEYIRRHWDNQVVIRVPENTEVISTEEIGTVRVDVGIPVTKNLDSWFYMNIEEVTEYLGD